MEATALETNLASDRDEHDACDPALAWRESQQVSPVESDLWVRLMEPQYWLWLGRSLDRDRSHAKRLYAARRARRLRRPYHERTDRCARAGVTVRCACPGRRDVRWFTCRQHLVCGHCRSKRSKRIGARIRAGVEAASSRRPRLRWHLLTLTLRHSGDVAADRAALARGWRRFYKALHRRWGDFSYVGTWEVTAGRDGLGHPHAHVVALWPWRDWAVVSALWRQSCPESSHISIERARNVKRAARYVSKYVAKGVEADEFTPELRARVLAGTYGTRWLFSSVRFWVPFEPCCPACGQKVTPCVKLYPWPDAGDSWSPRRPHEQLELDGPGDG